jgi:nicotinamide mononucleotide transporter
MQIIAWITAHWLEIFGAAAGIIYVFLEIRQNIWLWPVGIITSAVYIIVFFTSKFYADMSLQVYYLVISFYGWYVWRYGSKATTATSAGLYGESVAASTTEATAETDTTAPADDNSSASQIDTAISVPLRVSRTPRTLIIRLAAIYLALHAGMWYVLANFTDSPVAFWDSFTTALSVVATWMLARKFIEHWIIWIIVNIVSLILYIYKGLYPTTLLFVVYTVMAFVGYRAWRRDITTESETQKKADRIPD